VAWLVRTPSGRRALPDRRPLTGFARARDVQVAQTSNDPFGTQDSCEPYFEQSPLSEQVTQQISEPLLFGSQTINGSFGQSA